MSSCASRYIPVGNNKLVLVNGILIQIRDNGTRITVWEVLAFWAVFVIFLLDFYNLLSIWCPDIMIWTWLTKNRKHGCLFRVTSELFCCLNSRVTPENTTKVSPWRHDISNKWTFLCSRVLTENVKKVPPRLFQVLLGKLSDFLRTISMTKIFPWKCPNI